MSDRPVVVLIHPSDNVAVAVDNLAAGARIEVAGRTLVTREAIARGHKVAIQPLSRGQVVVKYGFPIGEGTTAIEAGGHVHTHNLASRLQGVENYDYRGPASASRGSTDSRCACTGSGRAVATFEGYPRADGDVGVRNEIWVIPTVGCVNKVAVRLAAEGRRRFGPAGLDGLFAFEHPYGCSQLGDDLANTQRVLAALVGHPNAGGVLVVGLGCENNSISEFQKVLEKVDPGRVRFLATQEVEDEFASGMEMLGGLVERVGAIHREPVPVSKLVVGLKCGGSDGLSGITANPLLGAVSDRLAAFGAAALLTEVPEMFGAERTLLERCVDQDVFGRCVAMINGFKQYYLRHGQAIDENPSPGNREGGITTLEEKSLGCVQKGGCGAVADVLDYGQRVRRPGLSLVSGPGNDAVSTTALAAAGAHIVLFTTGRGTPLGGPVPTVKVATSTDLARRKKSWIDFDAGTLLAGESMSALTDRLFDELLQVASGHRRTKNEENDYREIAIFKDGVTL